MSARLGCLSLIVALALMVALPWVLADVLTTALLKLFSGGLSIVTAGCPALRNRLSYVFAFGGHDDLPRVLQYLCTGIEGWPGARPWSERDTTTMRGPPHDYRSPM